FFFQAEDGIRDRNVTGVQTCALPIFRKAYGHPPTAMLPHGERGHWLPAPNGIHFHSPTALYVDAGQSREQSSGNVLALMVQHDLDDIALLLDATAEIPADRYRHVQIGRAHV